MSKRVNDDNKSDDPEVGIKRMRSSTACAFEFMKQCLFWFNVTTCKLLHEYDDKVPHQYRIPASLVTTDKMADAKTTYKEYLLDIYQKLSVLAFMVHLLISMQQMLGTTANAINPSIVMLTDLMRLVTNLLLMTVHSLKLSRFSIVIAQQFGIRLLLRQSIQTMGGGYHV